MIEINNSEQFGLNKFNFIDLFAGIGGFHLALASFGAKCVFASEWDNNAAKVYKNNFNIEPFGDITLINEKEIPKHDFLCGGFPCQAFSVSGKQRGFEDTRGTLFFDILRIAKEHKPSVLFLENVRNLVKHNNGNTLNIILDSLNEIGYDVNYKILNSSNYGLPQNRERVYFVCFKKELKVTNFKFPQPINKSVILKDILEENVSEEYYIKRTDVKMKKNKLLGIDLFSERIFKNKPIQIGIVNKGGQGERIYHTLGHAITLSAYGGGPGGKTGIYLINERLRKLTPRECARVQGFPDEYKLDERKHQCYKQFGNSVSVNVLQHILIEIRNALKFAN